MELAFTKMHGAGNDFVFIDDLSEEWEPSEAQVRFLCDRHVGIGADGIILVRPSKHADCAAYMHYINDDGSLAEMCGNGVRCFAKYLVDRGFVAAGEGRFIADTLAGKRPISFEVDKQGLLATATVDMGEPTFEPALIPTTLAATGRVVLASGGALAGNATLAGDPAATSVDAVIEAPLTTTLGEMRFTCVNMGNPHAVAFVGAGDAANEVASDAAPAPTPSTPAPSVWHLADSAFAALGTPLEAAPVFPERCNIEFAELLDPASQSDGANIAMRVFERGVGETLACGTGACAVAVAAAVTGRAGRVSNVRLRGGLLRIEWLENNHVLMTGPAATVYEGTIHL